MPKFDTFSDNFATGISAAKWTLSTYNAAYDSAQQAARFYMGYMGPSGSITSAGGFQYDLTASYVYTRLNLPDLLPIYDVRFILQAVAGAGNSIWMQVTNGVFNCLVYNNSVLTTVYTTNFDPTIHGPWWRMREASGTVFFDTSADGMTWVNRATTPTPSFATTLQILLSGYRASSVSIYAPQTWMTVDNVNTGFPVAPVAADPWVVMTGPKGPTGTPWPPLQPSTQGGSLGAGTASSVPPGTPPNPAFKRWCLPSGIGENGGDTSGFQFIGTVVNYSPGSAVGHQRLNAVRSPQGIATYQGLIVNPSAGGSPWYLFQLPWDMLPNPYMAQYCTLANVNNQRARFDLVKTSSNIWFAFSSGAVNPNNGTFIGVQFSVATYVPPVWVDYGMKVDCVSRGPTIQWTVGPGQMSGLVRGAPVTVTNPTVTTVTLAYGGSTVYPFFYYDLAAGSFGVREYTNAANPLAVWKDPGVWMGLASEGKVVLAVAYPVTVSTVSPLDRRFFMRGPLDTFTGIAA